MNSWLRGAIVFVLAAQCVSAFAQSSQSTQAPQQLRAQQSDEAAKQQEPSPYVPKQIVANPSDLREPTANTQQFPQQLLRTGVNLNVTTLSPNSVQLADDIGLTPVLKRIKALEVQTSGLSGPPTIEGLSVRQDLYEAREQASLIIQRTILEIDFVLAEIGAEHNIYNEVLSSFTSRRDKVIYYANAASFITNGALWAAGEALDIPTWKRPKYSISSGTTSILAGMVPSIASMYALKAAGGPKRKSEVEPNMLAKLFGYPVTADIEYPKSVWSFLNQVPAGERTNKTRKDQLIDRWVADANLPSFTNREAKGVLDVLTASVSQRKGLSIDTLNTRQVMLTQLGAEILKMKRLLLELSMTVEGSKQLFANDEDLNDGKNKRKFSTNDVPLGLPY